MALLNESVAAGAQTHIIDHDLIARVVNERHGVATVAPAAGQTYQPDLGLGETHVVTLPANGVVTVGAPVSTDAEMQWLPGADLVVVLVSPAGSTATVVWDPAYGSGPAVNPGSTTVARYRNTATGGAPIWTLSATTGAYTGHGRFTAQAAGDIASIVKGFAGQNVDLEQWQGSAGTVLAAMSSAGVLTAAGLATAGTLSVSGGGVHTIVGSLTETGQTVSRASTASQVPQVMRGFTGQTGDLTQWQDPTGATVLGRVTSAAALGVPAATIGNATPDTAVKLAVQGTVAGAVVAYMRGAPGQNVDVVQWQNSAGTPLAAMSSAGVLTAAGLTTAGALNATGGPHVITGSLTETGATVSKSSAIGQVPQVMRGFTGQTADLTQWQDPTGATVLSGIDSTGSPYVTGSAAKISIGDRVVQRKSTAPNQGYLGVDYLALTGAGNVPLVIQPSASSTSSAMQFQNNAGTVAAFFHVDGSLHYGNGASTINNNAGFYSAGVGIKAVDPSQTPLVVKANATQSQNLSEWQTSTGALLARIDQNGAAYSVASFVNTGYIGSRFAVIPNGTTDIGEIIRGVNAQAADLTQWQNSAGQFVAGVSASGRMYASGFTPNTSPLSRIDASGAFGPPDSTGVPLAVLASTGNTADLFNALNTGTGVIMRVTNGGNVQGTGAYTTLSDVSAKRNVRELPHASALAAIRQLHPITYDYIDGTEHDQVGFVAQDVQAVIPQAVVPWGNDGRLGIRSEAILAYLVRAVQELAA